MGRELAVRPVCMGAGAWGGLGATCIQPMRGTVLAAVLLMSLGVGLNLRVGFNL